MYESLTFDVLLNRMLANSQTFFPNSDIREGSILYTAEAPIALELQNAYVELDNMLNETFAETATREGLVMRCAERGITPIPATRGVFQGLFNIDVPIGSRFRLNDYTYVVIEKISDNNFKLQCEESGSDPNTNLGILTQIDFINGLTYAELTLCLIPGEDEETTESLRERYFASVSTTAFGGNILDYKNKVKAISGVGQVKVYPAWNGGGTVKIVFLDNDNEVPTTELVNKVQEEIDPIDNQGIGAGIAPIGHTVTVVGATSTPINITFTLTYASGFNWDNVKEDVITNLNYYFMGLASTWETDTIIVRITSIEQAILSSDGVLDIANTKINGGTSNIEIDSDKIPIKGTVNGI